MSYSEDSVIEIMPRPNLRLRRVVLPFDDGGVGGEEEAGTFPCPRRGGGGPRGVGGGPAAVGGGVVGVVVGHGGSVQERWGGVSEEWLCGVGTPLPLARAALEPVPLPGAAGGWLNRLVAWARLL